MVRILHWFILIFLCLALSCNFFLMTPFPEDLTLLEAYTDASEYFKNEPTDAYYYMFNLHDYLIIDSRGSVGWVYIFRADDLSYVTDQPGNYVNLFMQAAKGDFFIGNQHFDNQMSSPVYNNSLQIERYGFSYETENFIIFYDGGARTLAYKVYDSDWTLLTTPSPNSITTGFDHLDELKFVVLDDSGGSRESDYLVLCFRKDNNRYEGLRIPISYFYDVEAGALLESPPNFSPDSPLGLTPYSLPDTDSDFLFYTHEGFIVRAEDTIRLYTIEPRGYKDLPIEVKNDDYALSFSLDGKYFYKFNRKYKKIQKLGVW